MKIELLKIYIIKSFILFKSINKYLEIYIQNFLFEITKIDNKDLSAKFAWEKWILRLIK